MGRGFKSPLAQDLGPRAVRFLKDRAVPGVLFPPPITTSFNSHALANAREVGILIEPGGEVDIRNPDVLPAPDN